MKECAKAIDKTDRLTKTLKWLYSIKKNTVFRLFTKSNQVILQKKELNKALFIPHLTAVQEHIGVSIRKKPCSVQSYSPDFVSSAKKIFYTSVKCHMKLHTDILTSTSKQPTDTPSCLVQKVAEDIISSWFIFKRSKSYLE